MKHNLQFGAISLPCREVVVDDQAYLVPRGIARNHRNKSWQTKVKKNGVLKLSGNHADSLYGGPKQALDEAIKLLTESGTNQESRTLKISNRVSLLWAFSGLNVLSMSALVYSQQKKRQTTIYLISNGKLAAGNTEGLKRKLMRALAREWKEENGTEEVPVAVNVKIGQDVAKLMMSNVWKEFVNLGATISDAQKA